MRYDITDPPHALLSPDARILDVRELADHNEIAEMVLGLDSADLLTQRDQVAAALRYVALQVNYQVEMGVEAAAYSSISEGGRSRTFRGDVTPPLAHPLALAGVRKLLSSGALGFESVRGLRGRSCANDAGTEGYFRRRFGGE